MHASVEQLPIMLEAGEASVRGVDWGSLRVSVVSVPAGTDFAPLLAGLPDDRCQSPHWGYVVKGRLMLDTPSGAEVLQAGDLYHMEPGHTGVAEEETVFIEIGPPDLHQQFVEMAERNLAAMQAAG